MWYLCIRQLVDIIIVVLVCIVTQRNSLNLNGKNDSVLNIESSPPETKDFLNYWFGFETNTAFLTVSTTMTIFSGLEYLLNMCIVNYSGLLPFRKYKEYIIIIYLHTYDPLFVKIMCNSV